MSEISVRIVHGFAVAPIVFRPLITRLHRRSLDASLLRYPSLGLPLAVIVDRITDHLRRFPPHGIIAHSLGCVAVSLAIREANWIGPVLAKLTIRVSCRILTTRCFSPRP